MPGALSGPRRSRCSPQAGTGSGGRHFVGIALLAGRPAAETYQRTGQHYRRNTLAGQADLTENVRISSEKRVAACRGRGAWPTVWVDMFSIAWGKNEYGKTPEQKQPGSIAAHSGGTPASRWRQRCRQEWRCVDCGAPLGAGNCSARCGRCASRRGLARHLRRALVLWRSGAPEEHVARLVIGPTPRRRRRLPPADPLSVRCCGRVLPVENVAARCGRCGRDLLGGPLVEKSVRRRLLRGTEASRRAELVG